MFSKAAQTRGLVFCAVGLVVLCSGCGSVNRASESGFRLVYCDLSALVKLHPALQNVQSAEINPNVKSSASSSEPLKPFDVDVRWPDGESDRRSEIQSRLARKAEAEVARLGAQMSALIDRRVADKRAQIEAEARILESEQLKLSQQNFTKLLNSFWEEHSAERTAAIIRLAALKSQLNSPAVNQDLVKSAIDSEQRKLDDLARQETEIERGAVAAAESIHNRYAEKVDVELADFAKRAAAEMETVLARRRESLLREFDGGTKSLPEFSDPNTYTKLTQFGDIKSAAQGASKSFGGSKVGYPAEQMRRRAEAETKIFVERIAKQNGLVVTFIKNSRAKDYTSWFAKRLPYDMHRIIPLGRA
jgi:hypothetical protein